MLVFLIGFMGCGKSYTGRHLAPLLGYEFVDMDKWIEEKEGLTINAIFEQKGEEYFRQMERNYLQQLDTHKNLIISTGGGAPCFYDNMKVMNEKGITIYLNRAKNKVVERLIKGQHKRPLLAGLTPEQLADFYDDRLTARKSFYEQAQLHVGDADVEEIAQLLRQKSSVKQ